MTAAQLASLLGSVASIIGSTVAILHSLHTRDQLRDHAADRSHTGG